MDGSEFLDIAESLLVEGTEPALRSAVNRAYYGAFNYARYILRQLGFAEPANSRDHGIKWLYLENCGDPELQKAGVKLQNLDGERVRADYNLDNKKFANPKNAEPHVKIAKGIIAELRRCETNNTLAAAVAKGMREYEEKLAGKG
jgi:hypothetical protein